MRSETDPFEVWLPKALHAVEDADADGDGVSNLDELEQGTSPGDEQSVGGDMMTGPLENPRYDLAHYDAPFAFRRMSILYCGRSPTYAASIGSLVSGLSAFGSFALTAYAAHFFLNSSLAGFFSDMK